MTSFINTFTYRQAPDEKFQSLIPAQQDMTRDLMAQGKLLYLFISAEHSGGWAIHNAESREQVLDDIAQLPLYKFMDNEVQEL